MKRKWILTALIFGLLLSSLDTTIVSTAMPNIMKDLRGMSYYSWVFSAYMLTYTVTMPLFGKISDVYGRKRVYLFGIFVFLLGSTLSGFAWNMLSFILFRALQGIGGAALIPVAVTIVGDLYEPEQRGKIQGIMGSVLGLAAVVGPILGGWISGHLTWSWVFWINIPFGLFSFTIITYVFQDTVRTKRSSIDYLGAALLMTGLSMLMLGFLLGSWLIVLGVAMLGIFLVVEISVNEPLIPVTFFRDRLISLGMLVMFLVGFAMYGAVSLVPLLAQHVLGIDVSQAGTILSPAMLAMIASSIVTGFLVNKIPIKSILLAGTGLVAVGFFLLSTISPNSSMLVVYLVMIINGLGLGSVNPILLIAIQYHAGYETRGIATSMLECMTTIGGSIGVTVMNVVMNRWLGSNLGNIFQDTDLLGKALSSAFVVGTIVTVIAVCISLLIGGVKQHYKMGE